MDLRCLVGIGAVLALTGCGSAGALSGSGPPSPTALVGPAGSSDTAPAPTTTATGDATVGVAGSGTAVAGSATLVTPGSPAPSPPPTPARTPATGTIVVTEADAGARIDARVGAIVEVRLSGATGPYRWSVPTSSDDHVLHRTSSVPNGPDQTATFAVVAVGEASLRATEDPYCTPVCGIPSRLWEVTVVVGA